VKFTNPIRTYFDYAGDLVGASFATSCGFTRDQQPEGDSGATGFVSGPCRGVLDLPRRSTGDLITALPQENLKLSYQMNQTTRLIESAAIAEMF